MASYERITEVAALDGYFDRSHERPVFLFKHSVTCPVSSAALREYERYLEQAGEEPVHTLIEVQNARDVSKAIAERSGVRHESPQALLVRDGQVVWHASHWKITRDALADALAD